MTREAGVRENSKAEPRVGVVWLWGFELAIGPGGAVTLGVGAGLSGQLDAFDRSCSHRIVANAAGRSRKGAEAVRLAQPSACPARDRLDKAGVRGGLV